MLEQISLEGSDDSKMPFSSGTYDITLQSDFQRRFTISLPPENIKYYECLLVIILHYGGEPTPYYGRPLVENLYKKYWTNLDAIFVAPEILGASWTTPINEHFVVSLTKEMSKMYNIKDSRICISGFSLGALGSLFFTEHYPEIYKACIPIAGFQSVESRIDRPCLMILSEDDEVFPINKCQGFDNLHADIDSTIITVRSKGHYDIQGFNKGLEKAEKWLQKVIFKSRIESYY